MNNIKLNFLPLENQDITIEIYRKEIEGTSDKNTGFKFYRLPKNIDDDGWTNYYISLTPVQDFELYEYVFSLNKYLTKWYLFQIFKSQLSKKHYDLEFEFYEKGKIEEIQFVFKKYKEGRQIITLSSYFLEIENKFGFLIEFSFKRNPNTLFNKDVQKLSLSLDNRYRSNRNYYYDKYKIIDTFLTEDFAKINTLHFGNQSSKIINKMQQISSKNLDKKKYIFANNRISESQFLGIKNYGPYEKVKYDIKFVFIFENRFKNFANDIYFSLKGKLNPGTFQGMEQMFSIKLNKTNVEKKEIINYSTNELEKVVNELELKSKSENIIAIFIEDYSEEGGNSEPYYYLKYNFLKKDIPLQVLNYNKISNRNTLKWSTSNIGLQIFSKLGGKPWLVKPSKENCLILGIGSSHKRNTQTREIEKYFAYSVCLDSSGIYKKLEVLADNDNEIHYLDELKANMIELLGSEDFRNYTECVLHLPFKIKRKEINTIKEVINQISSINFTVIKINTDNKYFGFSEHNTLIPYESSYIQLSNREFLVWFEGLSYGKESVDHMLSSPVHIEFLESGDKVDLKPFLQDVINLSGANWRGFNAKSIPISIYYSKIITKYISEFGSIIGQNEINISNNKPWFL